MYIVECSTVVLNGVIAFVFIQESFILLLTNRLPLYLLTELLGLYHYLSYIPSIIP